MANPPIPLKLAMARVIARRILENPNMFRVSEDQVRLLETFVNEHWDGAWAKTDYEDWESSAFWIPIVRSLPEILAKLAEIDGH